MSMNFSVNISSWIKLTIAFAIMIIVLLIPFSGTIVNGEEIFLSVAAQRMLAILAFAIVVWTTEAVSYEISAILIVVFMALFIGFAPDITHPEKMLGTKKALEMSLYGFSSTSLALIAEALFISVAMTITGLGRRIALQILKLIGSGYKSVLIGVIITSCILSFLLPSSTARCACMIPIMMGIIEAYRLDKKSHLAAAIMICVAQSTNIWNVGSLTAAGQNMQTADFIKIHLGTELSWLSWFTAGVPFSIIMSIVLYFLISKLLLKKGELAFDPKTNIDNEIACLPPMSNKEKKLLITTITLLFFWLIGGLPNIGNLIKGFVTVTNPSLIIPIDITTITAIGVIFLLLPKVGVMEWKDLQKRVDWGTLIVFAIGISMGWALIETKASIWISETLISSFGLEQWGTFSVIAIVAVFLIIAHLGFASAVSLCGATIPILISLSYSLTNGDVQATMNLAMIMGFFLSFGMILPINSPQGMLCLGTNTFSPRQYAKIGIPLTIIGLVLMLIFAKFYWPLLGLI